MLLYIINFLLTECGHYGKISDRSRDSMDLSLLYGFLNNIPYISDIESSFSMLLLY